MDQSKSVRSWAVMLVGVLFLLQGTLDAQSAPATGPLRRHGSNPRYFADASGRAVYLTGSHYWNNLTHHTGFPSPALDYNAYLNFMQQHNHNFMRMWAFEEDITPTLYRRTGPGTALDGGLKFDTNQLNQGYFDLLRNRVLAARDRGIYVSIMLFQGWSIEWKQSDFVNMWPHHHFHRSNNINGIDGDPNNDGNGREVHMLAVPAITTLQEAYVRKVVDTVNDLDNVLYEISNESHSQSVNWQYHIINFIHNYEAGKGRRHPVGMTGLGFSHPQYGDVMSNAPLYNSPADWISPWDGNDAEGYVTRPPASNGAKVIITDTDHLWGNGGNRDWVWKSFARGLNPIFMDVTPPLGDWTLSTANDVRRAMGHTRSYAGRMNLGAMPPQNGLSSTGYCLAQGGSEYLVYQPGSGGFSVSVAAGTYAYEWFNPVTGAVAATGNVTAAGGSRSFTAPFAGTAVLYLKVTTPAPSVLVPPTITSPANGTVFTNTTTQVTVTWNAVPGVAGYLVRCSDTGSNATVLYLDRYTSLQATVPVSAGRSYRFWIHSHSAAFTYSDPTTWSDEAVLFFSVSSTPVGLAVPTITSPAEGTSFGSSTTQVTVRWDPVAGAAGYLVRCMDAAQVGTDDFVLYLDRYAGFQVNVPVAAGRSYVFWIHSHSATWSYSNPSQASAEAIRHFSVSTAGGGAPAVPTITSPAEGTVFSSGTTQVTVRWNAVAGAAGYLVRCMDTGSNVNVLYLDRYTQTQVNFPVTVGRSYLFWIHSHTATWSYSAPSQASVEAQLRFSVSAATSGTPAVPTITAPTPDQVFPSGTTVVTLRWNAVSGAGGYLLRAIDLTTNTQILYKDMVVGTQFNLPVARGHRYRFWMHSARADFSYSNPESISAQANRYFSVAN